MAILEWYHNYVVSVLHAVVVCKSIIQLKLVIIIIILYSIIKNISEFKFVGTLGSIVKVFEKDMRPNVKKSCLAI
jgi:hypothetical protein